MDDPETAAWQLMGMCCHPVTVHLLLAGQPARERWLGKSGQGAEW